MELRRSEDDFPRWWIFRVLRRMQKRHVGFFRNTIERKHVNRDPRTWTSSCLANIVKMRYRLSVPYRKPPRNSEWEDVISFQKRKWNQRLDHASAWQRKEFFVLEKMNAHRFSGQQDEGSAWNYAVLLQCGMIRRKRNKWRPRPVRTKWAEIQRNLRVRLEGQYKAGFAHRRDWDLTLLALKNRMRKGQETDEWRPVIWNAFRRRG